MILIGGSYEKKLTKMQSICSMLLDIPQHIEIKMDYLSDQ